MSRFQQHRERLIHLMQMHAILQPHVIAGGTGCSLAEAEGYMDELVRLDRWEELVVIYHNGCDSDPIPPCLFLPAAASLLDVPFFCSVCGHEVGSLDELQFDRAVQRPQPAVAAIIAPREKGDSMTSGVMDEWVTEPGDDPEIVLLPCPHCGGPAECVEAIVYIEDGDDDGDDGDDNEMMEDDDPGYIVRCSVCDLLGDTPEAAAAQWNRRV